MHVRSIVVSLGRPKFYSQVPVPYWYYRCIPLLGPASVTKSCRPKFGDRTKMVVILIKNINKMVVIYHVILIEILIKWLPYHAGTVPLLVHSTSYSVH